MKAILGAESWQRILVNTEHFRVYEVMLSLDGYANHNFVFPFDGILFVAEGQVFIQSEVEENTVKANQSIWIQHELAIRCVTVAPSAKLFILVFNGQTALHAPQFKRFASGTESKQCFDNGVTHWTAKDHTLAKIEWIVFPGEHQEPTYYLKDSEQFILPIQNIQALHAHYADGATIAVPKNGLLIPAKVTRSLRNHSNKPTTFLSVAAPYPSKSRILKPSRLS